MTIAVLYLSPEGVVLGADSTSSTPCESGLHYFDFNQKVFEVGEESTFGLITWGLGGLGRISYRTLLARVADDLSQKVAASVQDVANRFLDITWPEYESYDLVMKCRALDTNTTRTPDEQKELDTLRDGLGVGFCIAGYAPADRVLGAAYMVLEPLAGKPSLQLQSTEGSRWWGAPNIIQRLIFGADNNLQAAIISSGKWTGTQAELTTIIQQQQLVHSTLPIRDAVDYVHSCIYATIKTMKFSNMPQICGGPIEIAVITSDRKFRWVRHKPWDAAITEGEHAHEHQFTRRH